MAKNDEETSQLSSTTNSKRQRRPYGQVRHVVADREIDEERRMEAGSKARLGVIIGVFLPSLQNVFGIIMFLRLSWMTGLMGVWQAFTMVTLCCMCTFLTSLSISAICTNGHMGRGGPYFLISRSMGEGVGSAVGLLFCMANTIAIGMYVLGGVEILLQYLFPELAFGGRDVLDETQMFEPMTNSLRLYGIPFLFCMLVVCLLGIKFAQLFSPIALFSVIVSILSIYAGVIQKAANNRMTLVGGTPWLCSVDGKLMQYASVWGTDTTDVYNKLTDKDLACAQCNVSDHTLPLWKVMCTLADPQPQVEFDELDAVLSVLNATTNDVGNDTTNSDTMTTTSAHTFRPPTQEDATCNATAHLRDVFKYNHLTGKGFELDLGVGDHCDVANNCSRWANGSLYHCLPYFTEQATAECIEGIPGFSYELMSKNWASKYMIKYSSVQTDEDVPGAQPPCQYQTEGSDKKRTIEVFQDVESSFFYLLAVYFPSVTGILTGANMSGDLKNPARDIPRGTIAAQVVTSLVYMSFPILFGGSINGEFLRDQLGHSVGGGMVVGYLSFPHPYVVAIGSLMSTFGAGIQSLCCESKGGSILVISAAPRLLQSIAQDNVIPCLQFFATLDKRGEPVRGIAVITTIALCITLIGKINEVAPLVQMCFLCCYAGLNMSCFLNSVIAAPSWRPRFKFYHPAAAFAGFALSVFLMFSGPPRFVAFATVCVVIMMGIHVYVTLKGKRKEFGDSVGGCKLSMASRLLFVPKSHHVSEQRWLPRSCLLSTEDTWRQHSQLTCIAPLIKRSPTDHSVLIYESDHAGGASTMRLDDAHTVVDMKRAMKQTQLRGYTKMVYVSPTGNDVIAIDTIARHARIAKLEPNLLLVGQPSGFVNKENARRLRHLLRGKMTTVMPQLRVPLPSVSSMQPIDVWWIVSGGDVLLQLAQFVKTRKAYEQCPLRLFVVVTDDNAEDVRSQVKTTIGMMKLKHSPTVTVLHCTSTTLSAFVGGGWRRHARRQWSALLQCDASKAHRCAQNNIDRLWAPIADKCPEVDRFDHAHAETLNKMIVGESAKSTFTFINVPPPPNMRQMRHYMRYITTLTVGVSRSLLVLPTGHENVVWT